ncbi:MAG: hypothetical protein HHAS10_08800 [Candidatus Altimarinota bacterium]
MIIQLGHSRDYDFVNELYNPIKKSRFFPEQSWIFPHDGTEVNSRESLKNVDIFLAEVSYPSTGLGIELGFASLYGKRIICLSKRGSKISSSLRYITHEFLEYDDAGELCAIIESIQ